MAIFSKVIAPTFIFIYQARSRAFMYSRSRSHVLSTCASFFFLLMMMKEKASAAFSFFLFSRGGGESSFPSFVLFIFLHRVAPPYFAPATMGRKISANFFARLIEFSFLHFTDFVRKLCLAPVHLKNTSRGIYRELRGR